MGEEHITDKFCRAGGLGFARGRRDGVDRDADPGDLGASTADPLRGLDEQIHCVSRKRQRVGSHYDGSVKPQGVRVRGIPHDVF